MIILIFVHFALLVSHSFSRNHETENECNRPICATKPVLNILGPGGVKAIQHFDHRSVKMPLEFEATDNGNPNPCGSTCCGYNRAQVVGNWTGWPIGMAMSPGAAGTPSPCCQTIFTGPTQVVYNYQDPNTNKTFKRIDNQLYSPLVWEESDKYKLDYLRTFKPMVMSYRFDWFFNPDLVVGRQPCIVFKILNSGNDITLLRPESNVPLCTTVRNYKDLLVFQSINANSCDGIREENFLVTKRRIAVAFNVVSACGQLRTVILSREIDEFPPMYACRLVSNPCRPYCMNPCNRAVPLGN